MSLENFLKKQISQQGPISIAEFMQLALMHPQYGYYQKQQPFGETGDFITAPEISQMFGEMVGVWVASIWQQLGCPKDFCLLELGPGRGVLMDDVLRATKHLDGFHKCVSVVMVEQSAALQQKQKERLNPWNINIHWLSTAEKLPRKPTIVIANEFFDALPIHQFIKTPQGIREKLVGLDNHSLEFVLSSANASFSYLAHWQEQIEMNQVIETSPASIHVMEQLAEHISQMGGAGLFIDYGYEMPAFGDTLQAVKNHKYHEVLKDIGEADITAHVNFTALAEAAKFTGCKQQQVISQKDFLKNMGIEVRAKELLKKANAKQKLSIESSLHRLIGDAEMGKLFKVLMVA